jgi:hypothetical protein
METKHSKKIKDRFGDMLSDKKIICLDIHDNYACEVPKDFLLLNNQVLNYCRCIHCYYIGSKKSGILNGIPLFLESIKFRH